MSPVYINNVANLDRNVTEIERGVGETGDVSSRASPKLLTNNKYCRYCKWIIAASSRALKQPNITYLHMNTDEE